MRFPSGPLIRRRHNRTLVLAAGGVIWIGSGSAARGATDLWTAESGTWNNGGNWSLGTVPATGDTASILFAGGAGRTIIYDYAGAAVRMDSLNLDLTNTANGAATLSISANALVARNEYVGINGSGAILQSGGSNTIEYSGDALYLGANASGTGTYALSGDGSLTIDGALYDGYHGRGIFSQTAGSNNIYFLDLGYAAGSLGTYTLAGTGILSAGDETIGKAGIGNFNQTGGANSTVDLTLVNGTVDLSGGSLRCDNQENVQSGSFNQSGGSNMIGDKAFFGLGGLLVESGASYSLSGNSELAAAGETVSGGTISQSGGANRTRDLFVGSGSLLRGLYSLSGSGSLSVSGTVYFGSSNLGSTSGGDFIQNGGTFTAGAISVTMTGSFSQGAGTAVASVMSNSGTVLIGPGGALTVGGLYTQNAGLTEVRGALQLSGGAYFAGGTLRTGTDGGVIAIKYGVKNDGQLTIEGGSQNAPIVLPNLSGRGMLTVGSTATPSYVRFAENARVPANRNPEGQADVTVALGSTLDLGSNGLLLDFGAPQNDPVSAILADLVRGYNGGRWTGSGITSSDAAANPGKFSIGYADGNLDGDFPGHANQLQISYTLVGDANLDGTVSFEDVLAVAQNYGTTGNDWAHGNFTYDPAGSVGFGDLLIVAQNYNEPKLQGQTTGAAGFFAAWQSSGGTSASVAVAPEPVGSAMAIFGTAVFGLRPLRRRRRRGVLAIN